jgi:hypothetical protein
MADCVAGQSSEAGQCNGGMREPTRRQTTTKHNPNQPPPNQTKKHQEGIANPLRTLKDVALRRQYVGGLSCQMALPQKEARRSAVQLNPKNRRWREIEFGKH